MVRAFHGGCNKPGGRPSLVGPGNRNRHSFGIRPSLGRLRQAVWYAPHRHLYRQRHRGNFRSGLGRRPAVFSSNSPPLWIARQDHRGSYLPRLPPRRRSSPGLCTLRSHPRQQSTFRPLACSKRSRLATRSSSCSRRLRSPRPLQHFPRVHAASCAKNPPRA